MHTGGERGSGLPHVPPQKTSKNAIKHEYTLEDPPSFFHIPQYPSKEFENDCASMKVTLYNILHIALQYNDTMKYVGSGQTVCTVTVGI